MKCRKIEIQNNDIGEWDIIPVSAVFNLAVVSYHLTPKTYCENGFWGINIGVAIPLDNQEQYISFAKKYFRWKEDKCTVAKLIFYLLGENGEKVPVLGCDGNAYEESYGGCCIFAYINPDIIAGDDRPRDGDKTRFGHLIIGHNEKEK